MPGIRSTRASTRRTPERPRYWRRHRRNDFRREAQPFRTGPAVPGRKFRARGWRRRLLATDGGEALGGRGWGDFFRGDAVPGETDRRVRTQTAHSFTAARREASGSRFGRNSWPTKPLNPVAAMARMMGG